MHLFIKLSSLHRPNLSRTNPFLDRREDISATTERLQPGGPPGVPGASSSLPVSASDGSRTRHRSVSSPIRPKGMSRNPGSIVKTGDDGSSVKFRLE